MAEGQDSVTHWINELRVGDADAASRKLWERYFELTRVQDAHDRRQCRDHNGSKPWACENCDCTDRLERKLETEGEPFLAVLRRNTH